MNYELKKAVQRDAEQLFLCYVRFVYALEFITKHPPAPLQRGNSYTNVIMAQYTLKLKLNH